MRFDKSDFIWYFHLLSYCVMMKKLLLLSGFMVMCLAAHAQMIYVTDQQGFADIIVYVTNYQGFADLLVYKQPEQAFAVENSGQWFITPNQGFAKKVIYFTDHQGFADLIICYVDKQSFAGWKNPKKKYLLE